MARLRYFWSFYPLAFRLNAFRIDHRSFPVLFAVLPRTSIFAAVFPSELSISVLLIIFVLPCEFSAIGPHKSTMSVSFVQFPVSTILSLICPNHPSFAVNIVIEEIAFVLRTIRKQVHTSPMLQSIFKSAFVFGSIGLCLYTVSIATASFIWTLIFYSFSSLGNAFSVLFLELYIAFIEIADFANHSAFHIYLVVPPKAFVKRSVCEDLPAFAVPQPVLILA